MSSPFDPTNPPPPDATLDVRGELPLGLSGRLVGIGPDGQVRSFHFNMGRVSHLVRSIGLAASVNDLVAFDGSVLTYGDDSSVRQLSLQAGTLPRVDLAGHRRTVASCPMYDAASGELHLVAVDWGGTQLHVVVPAGALTRRSRLIADTRVRIRGLAVGSDHVVFVADSLVGVAPRDGDVRAHWTPTDSIAPRPVHTHRTSDTVVLVALTPSLERWTLHSDGRSIERDVLDPRPRRFAHTSSGGAVDGTPGFVWSTGGETIGQHDLVKSRSTHLDLAPNAPGDFVVVPDPARSASNAGWFVGFVRHASGGDTDLVVIDTSDLAGAVLATIHIPRPNPHGLRCTWLPATPQ
ncbi:MAG: carotenoid oxygenase family protein [Ilumatobacteraceae bacterium]